MKRSNLAPLGLVVIAALAFGCQADTPTALDGATDGPNFNMTSGACTFTVVGTTWNLDADCTTDATISIPVGVTLDGNGHTITAVDPAGGHFTGAVVDNAGSEAHVTNVTVTAYGLANVCDGGAARLRGIMFDGASGSITHSTIDGINQGASGCQEGNAIEVRNTPFFLPGWGNVPGYCDPIENCHPNTQTVEISHNYLTGWQKTGIVANGDVDVRIQHNDVNESATQQNLAPNGIQLGYGALGAITQNNVEGNQWMGTSAWVATAILVYLADDGANVSKNNVRGNSDIGIYFYGNNGILNNNRVFDVGTDHPNSGYDWGLISWGSGNAVTNNKVRGFELPYWGVTGGKNKTIPGPNGKPFDN